MGVPRKIVDAHVHLGHVSSGAYLPSLGHAKASLQLGTYTPQDLMRDASDVALAKAVHVEAFPIDGLREARHVADLAARQSLGVPQAIVAFCNLSAADVEQRLERLAAVPGVRGIRQVLDRHVEHLNGGVGDLLSDRGWRNGFGAMARWGLSFDMQLRPDQLPAAWRLAVEHPKTLIVIDHLGNCADRSFDGWRQWRRMLRRMAACDNVWIKISGLSMYEPNWTAESARPYVFEAVDAFGVNRAMFGSNFPIGRSTTEYSAIWMRYMEIISGFSDEDKRRMLAANAEEFYRI